MFIGRDKELKELKDQFNSSKKTAVLVYGKRRIGKSTLIIEAAKDFKGVVVNFLCVQSTLEGNLSLLGQSVCDALKPPYIQFRSIIDLFTFIDSQQKSVLLIIDEYQYLKNGREKNEVDSYFQTIIDRSSDKLKLVLCDHIFQ